MITTICYLINVQLNREKKECIFIQSEIERNKKEKNYSKIIQIEFKCVFYVHLSTGVLPDERCLHMRCVGKKHAKVTSTRPFCS